ncbi:hypothetical protein [Marinoscillum sp.]|uniref:hypothetical protein n=1 Tax=Marinoscillum sp. TaxID=2024838 RepID=UPI003BA93239
MKKIRGTDRRIKRIEQRIEQDSLLDVESLNSNHYFNFQFEDWYGERFGQQRKFRKWIVEQLLNIHNNWDDQLRNLNKPYYLSIWLYEPRLIKSEVVCAIDEKIEYYQNDAFLPSKNQTEFNPANYGHLKQQLEPFNWLRKVDMEPYHEWEINWPLNGYDNPKDYYRDQRFYKKVMDMQFHIATDDEGKKIYFHPKGTMWMGIKTPYNKR